MSTGIQGGAGSPSPWVWGECDPAIGRREVGGQTRTAAQSHPANFALKCPRCRTSGQVGGRPLQSRPRRNTQRRIDEPDWTQEEPVVAMLEPRDSLPSPSLPLLCIQHTLLEFTLPWHFFCFVCFSLWKDHSFLPMPLQSPWPHGYFFISLRLSVSFEHTKTRRTMPSSHQRHYVWLGYFISPYFQQPERTKSFICNIVEDFCFCFFKMKFLVHYETVLWSIKFYVPVSPFVWKYSVYVCVLACEFPPVFISIEC